MVFSSAEVSGVGRRRGSIAAIRIVVRRRRGCVGGGGELHHAACVHHAIRPPEKKRIQHCVRHHIGMGKRVGSRLRELPQPPQPEAVRTQEAGFTQLSVQSSAQLYSHKYRDRLKCLYVVW